MAERVAKRFHGFAQGVRFSLGSIENRFRIWLHERETLTAVKPSAPTVSGRQDDLVLFYGRFESLVETLCDAAQKGPTAKLEEDYQAQRTWIRANYPAIRKFVVAYLRYEAEDAAQGLVLWGKSADAFEALVAAPTLLEFLKADDGSMISRIHRSREALILYGDHLRQLAASAL